MLQTTFFGIAGPFWLGSFQTSKEMPEVDAPEKDFAFHCIISCQIVGIFLDHISMFQDLYLRCGINVDGLLAQSPGIIEAHPYPCGYAMPI